ncbi:MAG: sulfatase-like hydrolase/transferase [Bacteroidales bacterium]|nr:sulfatase-like hydrolase/transferase [Bacteroidales bacterium]MDY0217244.1 sulfatase-like hydrolase/transferase [Bacteroidales bacterium]
MKNKIDIIKKSPYTKLIINFILVLVLMSVSRFLFYIFNKSLFQNNSSAELATAFIHGIRFDISALIYINIVYYAIYLLPILEKNNKYIRNILKYLFITLNSIALSTNLIDIIYYRFTIKRTTADIFDYLGVGGDFEKLLPSFLKDFWYIALIFIAFIFILYKLYQTPIFETQKKEKQYIKAIKQSILFAIFIGISIIGMRGGLQLRPINILSASLKSGTKLNAIVLNTPFTIMQTLGKSELSILNYLNERDLEKTFHPVYHKTEVNLFPDSISRRKNIVMIVVESLSQEHLKYYNPDSSFDTLAPFLESLCAKSLCFDGYANGKKSIEGIPAILSGIPTLMNKAFISSAYANNQHHSIASSLQEMGYKSHFYHGGSNGTMGFDAYAKNAGFDSYIGRNEYHNEAHYDGNWGIWDEYFLQFCAQDITNKQNHPFLSVIFTLSSHHPYSIPEEYKNQFTKGNLPIHKTIQYTDFALEKFFNTIKKLDWFNNTLFIITSDHTSETDSKIFGNTNGIFKIPVIFYDPNYNLSQYSNHQLFQQIDFLPTIFAYTNYDKAFIALGNNKLDTNFQNFAIQYKHPNYQLIKDHYLMIWNNNGVESIYDIREDIALEIDISLSFKRKKEFENFIKAYLQQYNNRLIRNKLHINNEQ